MTFATIQTIVTTTNDQLPLIEGFNNGIAFVDLIVVVEDAIIEGSTVEDSSVEGVTVEDATVEGTTVDSATIEGEIVEGATVEGANVNGMFPLQLSFWQKHTVMLYDNPSLFTGPTVWQQLSP